MTTTLGPLYHWSPRDRLRSIQGRGLLVGQFPTVNTKKANYISLGTSPLLAWNYSIDTTELGGAFDLWEVSLSNSDSVHVLPNWGAAIKEVRVHNHIHRAQLEWIAERFQTYPE